MTPSGDACQTKLLAIDERIARENPAAAELIRRSYEAANYLLSHPTRATIRYAAPPRTRRAEHLIPCITGCKAARR